MLYKCNNPILLDSIVTEGPTKDESEGFTVTQWVICVSVLTMVMIIVIIATGVILRRKCRSRDAANDIRSEDPTVVTSVNENEQYHLGQYPFGDLPHLPSSTGRMPSMPPDLLRGAVGPALPLEDEASGYSHQNRLNDKKEGVPPPLYDQDETDMSVIDSEPPPYSP